MKRYPLVSIIVRTCSRPHVLSKALNSIRKQTYPNIEIIIVEDGKNTAEAMLKKKYSDLRYVYEALGKQEGRSKAGNRALELSKGKYLNFLDDDDVFMPEHVQLLVNAVEESNEKAVYSLAEELQIMPGNKWKRKDMIKKKFVRYQQPFNRILLCSMNYIPIQSMLFERSLFEKLGGMDENLEMMEDWDLWVRYSTITNFKFVNKVTSAYCVPSSRKKKRKREEKLKDYADKLHENFRTYEINLTAEDICKEMLYVIQEYKEKSLIRYMKMIVRIIFLGN